MNQSLNTRWLGLISYGSGLELQEQLVEEISKGSTVEHLLLMEHEPVYTMGRSRDEASLREEDRLPHPVHRVNRGGQATYHGPGQLVGYPLLNLDARGRDLHRYLRFLEETLILVLSKYGLMGCRREGLTGVWVEDRKIASIGIGVRRWISMHGFALNVGDQLPGFDAITPCGIEGVRMTSLSAEAGLKITTEEVALTTATIFTEELTKLPKGEF